MFFVIGGVTLVPLIVLPGVPHGHRAELIAIGSVACGWGLSSLVLIDWDRVPGGLLHASTMSALVLIAGAVASSGGSNSPAWIYVFFVAVFAAYFFPWPVALAYLAGCVATDSLILLYDRRALLDPSLARMVIAAAACLAIGGAIIAGKQLLTRFRMRAELLAAEQAALRRVAMAVVDGEPPETVYALVAREAASLLGGGAAGILRFEPESQATVVGSWADHDGGRYEPGTPVAVGPGSDLARARETQSPVRIEGHPPDSPVGRLGYTASIVAPVQVGGRVWGALAVTAAEPARLMPSDEQQLLEFGDLLASAITSLDDRARLAEQASTDPLTGLANRRALHERLATEVARAGRDSQTLSVAVIDVDHFKVVNDIGGHEAGDELLAHVAELLREHAREQDTLGRVGGDEFAWVMPETVREQALVAVERARRLIAATGSPPFRVTVSAGISDTNATTHAAELINLADAALYWSKAHGRNRCWIYEPGLDGELSVPELVERGERSHAVLGLQALARAIDAKDRGTRQHSDRVATLVAKLARAAGWPEERAMLLSEAALVHDVGKVGIRDEVLRKAGPLTEAEREHVNEHAELAARISGGVLAPEQVEWIRTHHERPDGAGYPRGLGADRIPEGAALLAVADAWDVMVAGRPYCEARTIESALHECTGLIGAQFTRAAVGALLKLHADGELDPTGPRRARDRPSRATDDVRLPG